MTETTHPISTLICNVFKSKTGDAVADNFVSQSWQISESEIACQRRKNGILRLVDGQK